MAILAAAFTESREVLNTTTSLSDASDPLKAQAVLGNYFPSDPSLRSSEVVAALFGRWRQK